MKKLIIFTFIICFACSPEFVSKFNYDRTNVCTPGPYYNSEECTKWKNKYPKEHQRYVERMKIINNKF